LIQDWPPQREKIIVTLLLAQAAFGE
jgi:hypothetical protein